MRVSSPGPCRIADHRANRAGTNGREPYPPDGQRILSLRSELTKAGDLFAQPTPRLLVAAKAKNSTTQPPRSVISLHLKRWYAENESRTGRFRVAAGRLGASGGWRLAAWLALEWLRVGCRNA